MKTRYLKLRMSDREYAALQAGADTGGITLSEHARTVLARGQEAASQEQFLAALEARLQAAPVTAANAERADLEPLLMEVLLLAREIAAERNAQVLARVAQQLNHRFPQRSLS